MQNEYCQQCRQPLEEWEAGFCEGCGMMTIKWSRPYEDVAQSEEYECIKSARRWTLKSRRTGVILATHNYLHECYADAEGREMKTYGGECGGFGVQIIAETMAMTVSRTGSVLAKASKTDQEYQRFSVREITDLGIEYYHKQLGDWYTLPSEWAASIVWE